MSWRDPDIKLRFHGWPAVLVLAALFVGTAAPLFSIFMKLVAWLTQ